jgi:ketosteroid isomerase-like protein
LIGGLNDHDTAQMTLHCTDDIVYDFVAQPPPLNGKQELAAFFEALFQGVPDFHSTQTRILVSDNIMVTEAAVT